MYIEDHEDLIRIEAEELAQSLFGASYYDLSPGLQGWIRTCVIESLWPECMGRDTVAA